MENATTTFTDETDYKMLWDYEYKKNQELQEQIAKLEAEIESWQREVGNLNSAAGKLEATIESQDTKMRDMSDLIQRLNGELTAFRFVICNLGVGD